MAQPEIGQGARAQFKANFYRMNVIYLEDYELDFELNLRDFSLAGSVQEKQRRLRARLRDDEKENRQYSSGVATPGDFTFIENRLVEIENSILNNLNPGAKTRLYHYYNRLRGCTTSTPEEEERRYVLVDIVKDMLSMYFSELVSDRDEIYESIVQLATQASDLRNGSEGNQFRPGPVDEFGGSDSSTITLMEPRRSTGAIPKRQDYRRVSFVGSREVERHKTSGTSNAIGENGETNAGMRSAVETPRPSTRDQNEYVHVSEINQYVRKCIDQYLASDRRQVVVQETVDRLADEFRNADIRDTDVLNISNIGKPTQGTPRDSIMARRSGELRRWSVVPGDLKMPPSVAQNQLFLDTSLNMNVPRRSECSTVRNTPLIDLNVSPQNPFEGHSRPPCSPPRRMQRYPHQLCKIIGTWPKFSGDNNTVPLVSFLRTVDMLCRSYEIEKEELKPHAHLLFTGDAYTWYTTYVDRFNTWEALLYYLTMRYDNPNRDRFIKEEMRNRKQKPNELFSAFLTDLDSLQQRLIHPMSEFEKFELVVENMKMSYKRRLALEDIHSIEDLAQKCYRFDALEQSLFNPRSRGINQEVHAVVVEEDELSDGENINVIDTNVVRKANVTKARNPVMPRNQEVNVKFCWNCRNEGHFWRFCPQEKQVFCHVCGYTGRVVANCPGNHQMINRQTGVPKNLRREDV